ncbi:hypothetical protein Anapl_01401 [Anas platyrhynchos]|uniref:Uncharacterized protein n=1 Tax=Anas platyrhynchos TaxID=8839 RepID=R0LVP4_ANAPL|nr:hypothetical protein Anapl_01401 [Anas platyrhynchos]
MGCGALYESTYHQGSRSAGSSSPGLLRLIPAEPLDGFLRVPPPGDCSAMHTPAFHIRSLQNMTYVTTLGTGLGSGTPLKETALKGVKRGVGGRQRKGQRASRLEPLCEAAVRDRGELPLGSESRDGGQGRRSPPRTSEVAGGSSSPRSLPLGGGGVFGAAAICRPSQGLRLRIDQPHLGFRNKLVLSITIGQARGRGRPSGLAGLDRPYLPGAGGLSGPGGLNAAFQRFTPQSAIQVFNANPKTTSFTRSGAQHIITHTLGTPSTPPTRVEGSGDFLGPDRRGEKPSGSSVGLSWGGLLLLPARRLLAAASRRENGGREGKKIPNFHASESFQAGVQPRLGRSGRGSGERKRRLGDRGEGDGEGGERERPGQSRFPEINECAFDGTPVCHLRDRTGVSLGGDDDDTTQKRGGGETPVGRGEEPESPACGCPPQPRASSSAKRFPEVGHSAPARSRGGKGEPGDVPALPGPGQAKGSLGISHTGGSLRGGAGGARRCLAGNPKLKRMSGEEGSEMLTSEAQQIDIY